MFVRSPPCVIPPSFALAYLFKAMVSVLWFWCARVLGLVCEKEEKRAVGERPKYERARERARTPEREGERYETEKEEYRVRSIALLRDACG